ncbi:hypothetical protein MKW92_006586 [Papaver armeniacum]|nr:hypothetical protein MKW92_006586 [Papaver armeniacum]
MKSCISPNPDKQTRSKTKSSKENVPPLSSPSVATAKILSSVAKMKTPLPVPPRPPSSKSSNPLKRKVLMECVHENSVPESPSVTTAKTISSVGKRKCPLPPVPHPPSNSSCNSEGKVIMESVPRFSDSGVQFEFVLDQTFTFDYVADTSSSQYQFFDEYQLIGAPFVENCLEGFNSSIFAYGKGKTASGKTYTMWGHSNALLEYNPSGAQHGLAPREEAKHADKQLKYRCRCSFLEIYNDKRPHGKYDIRKDVKAGVYVENLTEHGVCTMNDVRLLLIKVKFSFSLFLFTCTVESRYKGISEGLSSCKTSRINLVDLAGSEKQKLTGAAGERLKESGNINRSLSQLGNVINILADVSQTGKQRHIPYRDSRLTFLLQESLGGNARLAMICAISPYKGRKSHQRKREASESSQGKAFSSSDPITARVNKLMEEADVNMEVCSKQTAEISKLDLLVQQYKGERDVLVAEVQHLKSQLSYYVESSSSPLPSRNRSLMLQMTDPCELTTTSLCVDPETT